MEDQLNEQDVFSTPTPGQLVDLQEHDRALRTRFQGQMPPGLLKINTTIKGKVYYDRLPVVPGKVLRTKQTGEPSMEGTKGITYYAVSWVE